MPQPNSNSAKTIIRVHSFRNRELCGTVTNGYLQTAIPFNNVSQMLEAMDSLFDEIRFPQAAIRTRQFFPDSTPLIKRQGATGQMQHQSENTKATFVVNVQFRQNATWQGMIQWAEGNKKQRFRSALEMLKLMDEVLNTEEAGECNSENKGDVWDSKA